MRTKIREVVSYLSNPCYLGLIVTGVIWLPGLIAKDSDLASYSRLFIVDNGLVSWPGRDRVWIRGPFLYLAWPLSIYISVSQC
jgi:hypothetical protein